MTVVRPISSEHAAHPRAPDQAHVPRPARRVLIVEDDPPRLEWLREVLEILGHETQATQSGQAALGIARSFEPDVALIGLGLRGMDGYEVASSLREELPYALLVGVSGRREESRNARSAEFDRHISIPGDGRRLPALIREAS